MLARVLFSGSFLFAAVFGAYSFGLYMAYAHLEKGDWSEVEATEHTHTMVWVAWLLTHVLLANSLRSLSRSVLFATVRTTLHCCWNRCCGRRGRTPSKAGSVNDVTSPVSVVVSSGEGGERGPDTEEEEEEEEDSNSSSASLFSSFGLCGNPVMCAWTWGAVVVMLVTVFAPRLRDLLALTPLSEEGWYYATLIPAAVLTAHDVAKVFFAAICFRPRRWDYY